MEGVEPSAQVRTSFRVPTYPEPLAYREGTLPILLPRNLHPPLPSVPAVTPSVRSVLLVHVWYL